MFSIAKTLGVVILLASLAHAADGTISGTVKDSAGAPFRGAFVRARNTQTKITWMVLSDKQGKYRAYDLPAGEYEVRATAVGYKDDLHPGVKVAAGQPASVDFSLQKSFVRWADLSLYQEWKLLPDGKGKQLLRRDCVACHGIQTRMAATRRDEAGWTRAITYMRETMHARLAKHVSDEDAAALVAYLNSTFGMDSELPRSPEELPGYQPTVRPIPDEGLNIEYVEYEMPGPNRHPFSAAPDKDGFVWIPDFGKANMIGRLDPKTGQIEEFRVPAQDTAGIHSVIPAPDGSVWIGEQATNRVGKWDPKTRAVTEFQDSYTPGLEGVEDGGSKHTVRVDLQGKVWGSAVFAPLTAFDPKTREFTHFRDVIGPYGIEIDKQGNVWFAEFRDGGSIGKVDPKTGKVTKYTPPTPNGWPRRIEIDSKGIIWFAEYRGGRIDRFDPKTQAFKEYQLPGPAATPYGLGIDKNDNIWYSSDEMDVLGKLDPNTGKVTEYPFPHSENMIKELFIDSEGRMWYGTPPNNKVGYFIVPKGN